MTNKPVIGRAELLHFMDYKIEDIPSKIDTGAYRSAVHASDVRLKDDGVTLSFCLLGGHPVFGSLSQVIETKDFSSANIANSFGSREQRYVVRLRISLGGKVFKASFSLADRSRNTYPILVGRMVTNDRFLVDTSVTAVNRAELRMRYHIEMPADAEDGNEKES